MSDEDPLAAIRRSLSTSKSRVSAKPIDPTEDTFMGASIGATPNPADSVVTASTAEAPVPAPPAGSLIGNAPRRRQKRAARATAAAIDPADLAKFAAANAVAKPVDEPDEPVVPVEPEEPVEPVEPSGGLMLASPSPPPVDDVKTKTPVDEPVVDKPVTPVIEKPVTPVEKAVTPTAHEPSPVSIKAPSPIKPAAILHDDDAQLQSPTNQVLLEELSDFKAMADHLLPDGQPPTAENLAIWLAPRLEQAEQLDSVIKERDRLKAELATANHSLMAATVDAPADADTLSILNDKLASLSDQCALLQTQVDEATRTITERDREVADLQARLAQLPAAITVQSMDDLDKEMQARFKETADFIKEMEDFLREHQPDVTAGNSSGMIE